jgi:hypothetical protein
VTGVVTPEMDDMEERKKGVPGEELKMLKNRKTPAIDNINTKLLNFLPRSY